MKFITLFFLICLTDSYAAELKVGREPRSRAEQRRIERRNAALERERSEKPPVHLPGIPFKVDDRWKEWREKRIFLLDEMKSAEERADFLKADSHRFKLAYVDFMNGVEKKIAEHAKILSDLETNRLSILKRREIQEKFDNKQAMAAIDAEVATVNEQIKWTKKQMEPTPYDLVHGLIRNGGGTIAAQMLDLASIQYTVGKPLQESNERIQRLRYRRERLASWAASPTASTGVQAELLAFNKKAKVIEEHLLSARFSEVQTMAQSMLGEIINRE